MSDIVSYEIPLGILGRLAHPLVVQKKLKEIFDYRFAKVEEIFGKPIILEQSQNQ
jgi:ligand-binding SRPBCC domain-containing protein